MRTAPLAPLAACLVALVLGSSSPARADGVFYVDNTNAFSSDAGPGTESVPYRTISAALAAHHDAGTMIYVKAGVYREQVTIAASGTPDNPLVIQSFGGQVIVDGADDGSSPSAWEPYAGDVYRSAGVTWRPMQVFLDGARLVASNAPPGALPERSFAWVEGEGLYVNAGGGSPAEHELLIGRREFGFVASGRSHLVISGFTVLRAENRGFQFNNGCTDVVVANNTVRYSYRYGIQVVGGSGFLIDSNIVSDNNDHGIMLFSGVTGSTIQNNECFRNARPSERAANGIHLFGCPGNRIVRNRTHHNQDSGVQVESGSNGSLLIQNTSWSNGDHGFDNIFSTGIVHLCGVAYGNYKDGFSIEGSATGTRVYDCIAVDNGITTNEYNLWVNPESSVGFVSDYNIFWNSTNQAPVKYMSTVYPSLSDYSAASGQDAHSLQADPLFVDAYGGNFHLLADSPAIDAADTTFPFWLATDAADEGRFDHPWAPNTGAPAGSYADRGAFEYLGGPVYIRPDVSLFVNPAVGSEPLQITADATGSEDADGEIVSWVFDFGDGTVEGPQAEATATHTYAVGNWIARVIATDNDGVSRSAWFPVIVSPGPSAGGNLIANPSFEEGLDGWNAFAECALSRVPGGCDGGYALEMSATGPTTSSFGLNDHPDWVRRVPAAGYHYRFSACVRSATSAGRAVISVKEYLIATDQLVGSALSSGVTLSPEWQTISLDYYTSSPNSTLDFQVKDIPVAVGEVFQTDNVTIELIPPASTSVGDEDGGLARAARVYPTPFRSRATLSFATALPGPLRVDVYDLMGRRVRSLMDEPMAPAGVHRLSIDREGDAGAAPLGAGLYFYRIDAREGVRSGRFLVLH